jgi:hypothetical protein
MTLAKDPFDLPTERPPRVTKDAYRPKGRFWRARSDFLWGAIIHELFKERCALEPQNSREVEGVGVCSPKKDAHHLITREASSLRHCIENGILLCSLHHMNSVVCSAHGSPFAFANWMQESRSDQYEWVLSHRNKVGMYNYHETAFHLLEIWNTLKQDAKVVWSVNGITFE